MLVETVASRRNRERDKNFVAKVGKNVKFA